MKQFLAIIFVTIIFVACSENECLDSRAIKANNNRIKEIEVDMEEISETLDIIAAQDPENDQRFQLEDELIILGIEKVMLEIDNETILESSDCL